jgi:hypothetical protein
MRLIDHQRGFRKGATRDEPAGNVGVQKYGDVGQRDVGASEGGSSTVAVEGQVAHQFRQTFCSDDWRDGRVGNALKRRRLQADLRVSRAPQTEQKGYYSKREEPFAKICHFLLLVKIEIELMEVLFFNLSLESTTVMKIWNLTRPDLARNGLLLTFLPCLLELLSSSSLGSTCS